MMTEKELLIEKLKAARDPSVELFEEVANHLLPYGWQVEWHHMIRFLHVEAWQDFACALIGKVMIMPGFSIRWGYEGMGNWGVMVGLGVHGDDAITLHLTDVHPAVALLRALMEVPAKHRKPQ